MQINRILHENKWDGTGLEIRIDEHRINNRIEITKHDTHSQTVIKAAPIIITEEISMLKKIDHPEYTIKWITTNNEEFITTGSILEIETLLRYSSDSINRRWLDSHKPVNLIIELYKDAKIINTNETPYQKGKYIINNEIISTNNEEVHKPTTREISECIQTIKELIEDVTLPEHYIGLIIKWGLISPYNYILKQIMKDLWMKWLILHGETRTGKSYIIELILRGLYSNNKNVKTIPSGAYDTEAKIGRMQEQTTYPLIVNEADKILEDINTRRIIKNCVEERTSREREVRFIVEKFHTLNTTCLTANYGRVRDDKAFNRRFYILPFDSGMRNTHPQKFKAKWNINNPESPIHNLKHLQEYFEIRIEEILNPKNTTETFKKYNAETLDNRSFYEYVTDQIIIEFYKTTSEQVPEALRNWITTPEDSIKADTEHTRKQVIEWILEQINSKTYKIEYYDLETNKYEGRLNQQPPETVEYIDKIRIVLESHMLPYIYIKYNIQTKENEINITPTIIDKLNKHGIKLTGIPELRNILQLEKKYQHQVKEDNKLRKGLKIPYKEWKMIITDLY
jgi:hypothetical protein